MRYLDFDLLVEPAVEGFVSRVLQSPAGEARHEFAAPFTQLELENMLLRLGRPPRGTLRSGFDTDGTRVAKKLGGLLYEAAFGGDVGTRLAESRQQAELQDKGLRIRLRIAPPLASIPWEYLYDTRQNRFLVLSAKTSLVRYLELGRSPHVQPVSSPLRILVVISSPRDLPALDTEREWRNLNAAVTALQPGTVEIIRIAPSLALLQSQLRRGPVHVFHYIGHGDFVEDAQDGLIFFEDEHHNSVPVPSEKLAILLHHQPALRLAVLNCCEGARAAETQPFSGVGPALVQQGLPAVVAMQFPIADSAAIDFARSFYQSIAEGLSIDSAVVEARVAMFVKEDECFGAPVLYMRSSDGVLFDLAAKPPPPPPAPPPPVLPPAVVEPPPAPDRSKFSRAGAVAFGVLWWFLSVAMTILGFSPDVNHDVTWDSVRNWSRAGMVLGLLHALLFLGVRRWRGVSGNSNVATWSIGGAAAGVGAALLAELALNAKPKDTWGQFLCFVLLYGALQFAMIRQHVVRALTIVSIAVAAGGLLSLAMQIMETNRGSSDSAFAAASVLFAVTSILLMVQGALLGRDPMIGTTERPMSVRPRLFIGIVVLVLFLLTLIPSGA